VDEPEKNVFHIQKARNRGLRAWPRIELLPGTLPHPISTKSKKPKSDRNALLLFGFLYLLEFQKNCFATDVHVHVRMCKCVHECVCVCVGRGVGSNVLETRVLDPRPKLLRLHMPGPATRPCTPNKEAW
jgi:hypothetical protein